MNGKDVRISSNGISWHAKSISARLFEGNFLPEVWKTAWFSKCFYGRTENTMWWKAWLVLFWAEENLRKSAQAIADVLVNAVTVCGTKEISWICLVPVVQRIKCCDQPGQRVTLTSACVDMAFPCRSFLCGRTEESSLAQHWGVNDSSHVLQLKVVEGNRCARVVVDVLSLCSLSKIPLTFEKSPSHSNLFVLKGRTVPRVHVGRLHSCVSALGGRPKCAPLRPATAAELKGRLLRHRRRSCCLQLTSTLRCNQFGTAHSSSATPISSKAYTFLWGARCASGPPGLLLAECHDDREEPYMPPEFCELRAVSETKIAHPGKCLTTPDFYFPRDCSQSCAGSQVEIARPENFLLTPDSNVPRNCSVTAKNTPATPTHAESSGDVRRSCTGTATTISTAQNHFSESGLGGHVCTVLKTVDDPRSPGARPSCTHVRFGVAELMKLGRSNFHIAQCPNLTDSL